MIGQLTALLSRRPRPVLIAAAVGTLLVGLYAVGVPDRLALGGGGFGGSAAERTEAELGAELGHHARPAYLLVVSAAEPLSTPENEVALRTLAAQVSRVGAVAEVTEGTRSQDGATTTLAVHLTLDAGRKRAAAIEDELLALDPGSLQVLVGGELPTATGARRVALDEAPKRQLVALPLLLVLLGLTLGPHGGLAAALGAAFAATVATAALGLIGELVEIFALGVVAAAVVAFVMGLEAAASLLFRYREESATLGGGREALEYSLHNVLPGCGLAMTSAALAGAVLLAVPVGIASSIGAGIVVGSLLGPPLALLPIAAAITLRAGEEVGEALPLVSGDDQAAARGPRAFRLLVALSRDRRRSALALLPLAAVIAIASPLGDAEAIGLGADALPEGEQAALAEADLARAFGPGAAEPLIVVAEGPPEAPSLTIYRDELTRLARVSLVGRAAAAGPFSYFPVTVAARPRSLVAQRAVERLAATPAPTSRRITGPAAEVRDAAEGLAEDLPLAGIVALLAAAALWGLLLRTGFAPLLALGAAAAPLAGLGAVVFVFEGGRLSGALGYTPAGAPQLTTYILVGSVLLALALARGAHTATALRDERALGGGAAGSVARSTLLTLTPAAVATLAALALLGAWIGAPLLGAKEVTIGLGFGLLADLLLVRALSVPGLARLTIGSDG